MLFTSALYQNDDDAKGFPAGDDGFPGMGRSILRGTRVSQISSLKHEASKNSSKNQPTLAKSHVLVTGGAGFIGSQWTFKLIEEGHVVTIVDNLVSRESSALSSADEGNLRS